MLFTGRDLSPSSGQQAALPVSGILPSRVYGFYILSPVLGAPSLSSLGPVLTGAPLLRPLSPPPPSPAHLTLCSLFVASVVLCWFRLFAEVDGRRGCFAKGFY